MDLCRCGPSVLDKRVMRGKKSKIQRDIYVHAFDSPVGNIRIYANDEKLLGLFMEKEKATRTRHLLQNAQFLTTPLLKKTENELQRYFKGDLKQFSIPIELHGTDFQIAVWRALAKIPIGSVLSYTEVARSISRMNAVRAVSAAIGSNPLSIIVPCHRVVGGTGKLTGYAGGLTAKEWLLRREGHDVVGQSVSIARNR
jgi:methylated-DNA-[protein]-cysteine S-methyltransferase